MTSYTKPSAGHGASRIPLSRRVMLKHAGALGLAWAGVRAGLRRALAAPAVTVAAPVIDRVNECLASFSVMVSVADVTPGVRFEAYGILLEWDEDHGEADVCAPLPTTFFPSSGEETAILLAGQALAADLGLVKGIGPASDEAFSPDLVELFARVWLRDLATGEQFGPWESPRRVAVAMHPRAWQLLRFPGSEFMTTGGRGLYRAYDPVGMPLPQRECVP